MKQGRWYLWFFLELPTFLLIILTTPTKSIGPGHCSLHFFSLNALLLFPFSSLSTTSRKNKKPGCVMWHVGEEESKQRSFFFLQPRSSIESASITKQVTIFLFFFISTIFSTEQMHLSHIPLRNVSLAVNYIYIFLLFSTRLFNWYDKSRVVRSFRKHQFLLGS